MIMFVKKHYLLFFFLLFIAFNFITLTKFPPLKTDEAWQSSDAYSIINKDFTPIHYPFFARNTGIPYASYLILATGFKIMGLGFVQGRIIFFSITLVYLIVFYLFVKEFFGKREAFLSSVYLVSTRVFFLSSHYIRNDISLALGLVLMVWFFFKYEKTKKLRYIFFSSFFGLFSMEFHQNGLIFYTSLLLVWFLLRTSFKEFSKGFFVFVLGSLTYIFYYLGAHILPHAKDFLADYTYAFTTGHPFPIFSLSLKDMIIEELKRYTEYFLPLRFIELILILSSITYALKNRNYYLKFLSLFLVISCLLFFPLANSKSQFYLNSFFPFLSVLLTIFAVSSFKTSGNFIKNSVYLIFIFVVVSNFFVQAVNVFYYKNYNYREIREIIMPRVSKNFLILGPSYGWLDLSEYKYRSVDIFPLYRYFKHIGPIETLMVIKPDYIIADKQLQNSISQVELESSGKYKSSEFWNFINSKAELLYTDNFYYLGEVKLYKLNIQ